MGSWKAWLAAGVAVSSMAQLGAQAAEPRGLPIGPCINIGNTLEVPKANKLDDGAVTAADFQRIRAAGFDTVRLPVRWDDRS